MTLQNTNDLTFQFFAFFPWIDIYFHDIFMKGLVQFVKRNKNIIAHSFHYDIRVPASGYIHSAGMIGLDIFQYLITTPGNFPDSFFFLQLSQSLNQCIPIMGIGNTYFCSNLFVVETFAWFLLQNSKNPFGNFILPVISTLLIFFRH